MFVKKTFVKEYINSFNYTYYTRELFYLY